jgi:hypothetical protein
MATRLEDPTIALDELGDLHREPLVPHRPHLPTLDPDTPVVVPTSSLSRAMGMWLSGIYLTCWLGLPLAAFLLTGTQGGLFLSGLLGAPVFALAALVAIAVAGVARPAIRLSTASRRDPVVSATAGGLVGWALVVNTLPFLVPFSAYSPFALALFVAINVVEMSLLGMMFASFTRRRSVAFALGAAFQWLTGGLLLLFLAL